jgi:hypothetical protein
MSRIVVTTAAQFFESLFVNRTSRCRKLHNLADSLIVLGEASCVGRRQGDKTPTPSEFMRYARRWGVPVPVSGSERGQRRPLSVH